MKWIVLLSYPFFLYHCTLNAQPTENHPTFEHILALNFSGVNETSLPAQANDFESLYYYNMLDVLSLLFQEDEDAYERLKEREKERLDWLDEQDADMAMKGFVTAEIHLQWATVHLKYQHQWPAFWGLRKAHQLNTKNIERHPNFEPHYRTQGALLILFGLTPQNVQWAFRLFGLSGTLQEGMASLKKVHSQEPLAYESDVVQVLIHTHLLENQDKAQLLLEDIHFANQPLTIYFKILMALKAHRSLDARQWLRDGPSTLPYRSYFLGETYFQEGLYDVAIPHYQTFITNYPSGNYIKDAHTKTALAHRFQGNDIAYQSAMEKAKAIENLSSEIDKNASRLIMQTPDTKDELLQLRFALDGGFTTQAENLIEQLEQYNLSPLERVELTYRKARKHALLQETDAAIAAYEEVLQQDEMNTSPYFLPNAALQLGLIYQKRGDKEMASKYFNQVLSFKNHPYKSSLDTKARIALSFL